MSEPLHNDNLEQEIGRRYPYPLAATFHRAFQDAADDEECHDYLLDLFEVTVKYCATLALSQYFADGAPDPDVNKTLYALKRPSLGHWQGWLRDVLAFYRRGNNALLIPELDDFYTLRDRSELPTFYKSLRQLMRRLVSDPRAYTDTGGGDSVVAPKQFFELLGEYRNLLAHGARPNRPDRERMAGVLMPAMLYIFRLLAFVADYPLIYISEVRMTPSSTRLSPSYDHYYVNLAGDRPIRSRHPKTLNTIAGDPQKLYVLSKNQPFEPMLNMHPILIFRYCEGCGREQAFVLNESKDNVVDYLSYQCTHHFSPTEYLDQVSMLLRNINASEEEVNASPSSVVVAPDEQEIEQAILQNLPQEAVPSGVSKFETHGAIWEEYTKIGGPHSFLRLPLGNVQRSPSNSSQGTAYSFAEFERGFICVHESGPRNGQLFKTNGGIYWKYKQMGGPQSVLGLPIRDEADGWPSRVSGHACRFSLFENGVIHWHAEGPYIEQSFEMHGELAAKYNSRYTDGKQGSGSFLGLPIQDHLPGTTSPSGVNCEYILCEGGIIHLHLDGPRAGQAFEMHNAIWEKYQKLGGSGSFMGLPIQDQIVGAPSPTGVNCGATVCEGGALISHLDGPLQGQAFEMRVAIWNEYYKLRGSGGILGLPISDEYDWQEGRRSDFERGYIYWNGIDAQAFNQEP